MGVCKATIWQWENRRAEPEDWLYPKIIEFLGHEPWLTAATLPERLAAERRRRGLSVKAAAVLLDVAHGAFHNWESGIHRPGPSYQPKVDAFLAGVLIINGNATS